MSIVEQDLRRLRIHGDNIVECERALKLLADAVGADADLLDGPLVAPTFRLDCAFARFEVQLLPGYGRWDLDLANALSARGAPLAESADAVITELGDSASGGSEEHIAVAMEFCGALPAGNNAWQRCGRSYSYAITGVPYLYISELGGYELDSNRALRNPRFPNPLVPFAYVTQSELSASFALPVYEPSPSASRQIRDSFLTVFRHAETLGLLRSVFTGEDRKLWTNALASGGLSAAMEIASRSSRSLPAHVWRELGDLRGIERMERLAQQQQPWSKRITIPITDTMRTLNVKLASLAVGAGASDMPFGLVPTHVRKDLADALRGIYGGASLDLDFLAWIEAGTTPLLVVMLAGFKPEGEDSRPDRGLLPLVRMLFGEECDVLSIIYGPARASTWTQLWNTPERLEANNGLWQAVLRLSNGILIDSRTATAPLGRTIARPPVPSDLTAAGLPPARTTPTYGEHDVDTVIRILCGGDTDGIFEGLCNPPGGDWSGISLVSTDDAVEYRWTSLPRVSGRDGKRPDHVLQFLRQDEPDEVLSVESKERLQSFEANIGPRLVKYVEDLVAIPATIRRSVGTCEWEHHDGLARVDVRVVSAGAFIHPGSDTAVLSAARSNQLDLVMAIDFADPAVVKALIAYEPRAAAIVRDILRSAERLGHRVEVQVHAL